MTYTANKQLFLQNFKKKVKSEDDYGLIHNTDFRVEVFPFRASDTKTKKTSSSVSESEDDSSQSCQESLYQLNYSTIVGMFIDLIVNSQSSQGRASASPKATVDANYSNIIDIVLKNSTFDKEFDAILRSVYLDSENQFCPTSLSMLRQCPVNADMEARIGKFFFCVFGQSETLVEKLRDVLQKDSLKQNLFDSFLTSEIEKLNSSSNGNRKSGNGSEYHVITNRFQDYFVKDFIYILDMSREPIVDLVKLFKFYFFIYIVYSTLLLDTFTKGERSSQQPVFFCLDWEKTSQKRKSFTNGWKIVEQKIQQIFSHAIALKILNQVETEQGPVFFDYIGLSELSREEGNSDSEIAKQIYKLTDYYRNAIKDSPLMHNITPEQYDSETEGAIRFLFRSIDTQFKDPNTQRDVVRKRFCNYFVTFCNDENLLQARGRNGKTLVLSEENLLFLTRICINKQDKLLLNNVFKEFENRGVYLDKSSREEVRKLFEKIGIIEKKSDSGDSQYVQQIL